MIRGDMRMHCLHMHRLRHLHLQISLQDALSNAGAALQRCSRAEGLQISATHLACVRRAGARGRPCSPCDGCQKPLHTTADALIPILMSLRVVLATSRTICMRRKRTKCARDECHSVQAMPDSSSHAARCVRS